MKHLEIGLRSLGLAVRVCRWFGEPVFAKRPSVEFARKFDE